MSWEKVKLGDISANIQTGPFGSQLHQHDYSEIGTPVVMPKDLIDGKISEQSIARVSQDHVQRLNRHIIQKGDILYSRRGDVGRCAIASDHETGWLCGTGCLRVTTDTTIADSKFVFYQLQQPEVVGWVEKHAVGATMLNLNTTILSNIPLLLPPIETQRRIADILSAYDDLIENNRKQIKLLEEAAQRLYKEWFVDLRFPNHEHTKIVDGVPEGWRVTTLDEICSVRKEMLTPEKIDVDTPYIGLEHIPRKDICLSEWGSSSEISSNKFRYYEDDILFGKIRPYFHKVGFALNNGVTSTDAIVLKSTEGLWSLLLMTASSSEFVSYTYQNCKEGAKMPRADWKHMKSYPTIIADRAIQSAFEDQIYTITRKIKVLALQINRLSEARDRLLPKLMSGEVEV